VFDSLFIFNKERSPLQALGFYIVFFFAGIAIAVAVGAIFSINYESGYLAGQIIAFIYCIFIGYLILSEKGQLKSGYSISIFMIAILAYFFGCLGGLVPVAYLSTIKSLRF
jgi:hypothetical protein|tara:strand:- start:73 stop:405 length:333 start_codon:yes stop_codon:yes gene_type:complete